MRTKRACNHTPFIHFTALGPPIPGNPPYKAKIAKFRNFACNRPVHPLIMGLPGVETRCGTTTRFEKIGRALLTRPQYRT